MESELIIRFRFSSISEYLLNKIQEISSGQELFTINILEKSFDFIIKGYQIEIDQYNQVTCNIVGEYKMPSSKNYKRDYKQERRTAKRRKETGVGSSSGDAKRHRARRQMAKSVGKSKLRGKDVHHKTPIKRGGGNSRSNLAVASRRRNRSHGGKIGNRRGKA